MIDSGDARNPSSNSPLFEGLFLDEEGAPRQTEDTGFISHEVARPRQEQDGQRGTPGDNGKLLDVNFMANISKSLIICRETILLLSRGMHIHNIKTMSFLQFFSIFLG